MITFLNLFFLKLVVCSLIWSFWSGIRLVWFQKYLAHNLGIFYQSDFRFTSRGGRFCRTCAVCMYKALYLKGVLLLAIIQRAWLGCPVSAGFFRLCWVFLQSSSSPNSAKFTVVRLRSRKQTTVIIPAYYVLWRLCIVCFFVHILPSCLDTVTATPSSWHYRIHPTAVLCFSNCLSCASIVSRQDVIYLKCLHGRGATVFSTSCSALKRNQLRQPHSSSECGDC